MVVLQAYLLFDLVRNLPEAAVLRRLPSRPFDCRVESLLWRRALTLHTQPGNDLLDTARLQTTRTGSLAAS